MSVLTICASRKGEAGLLGRPSAVRTLLTVSREGIARTGGQATLADFADLELPAFEGLPLTEYADPASCSIRAMLGVATHILLGVPAYWGGPSGLSKNFIDLSGGASYAGRMRGPTLWSGKQVALLVVGAAAGDAPMAHRQLVYALEAMGAEVAKEALVIDCPHDHDHARLLRHAYALGVLVARRASP